MRLLLATSNAGKASEFAAALQPLGFQCSTLEQHPPLPDPPETAETFAGNARLKAEYYYLHLGLPALADDSGLSVDALSGAPGVRSARLAKSDPERIGAVLGMIRAVERDRGPVDRGAHFVCALCLRLPEGRVEAIGEVEGRIVDEPQGRQGFGYDPIFYYPPLRKTFGQLSREQKNKLSHRANALRRLLQQLRPVR